MPAKTARAQVAHVALVAQVSQVTDAIGRLIETTEKHPFGAFVLFMLSIVIVAGIWVARH